MSKSPKNARALSRGFSLIELLVVAAILGALAGLLLPAVQAARESSRRAACLNQLRQVSQAAISFSQRQREELPPLWRTDYATPWENFSWRVAILHDIEQAALADSLRLELGPLSPQNAAAGRTSVALFECPSTPDSPRRVEAFGLPDGPEPFYQGLDLAACDYSGVFNVSDEPDAPLLAGAWSADSDFEDSDSQTPGIEIVPDQLGPQRRVRPARLSRVLDGLSKTALLVEQAGKPTRYDATRTATPATPREGAWITGEMGAFSDMEVNHDNLNGLYGFHSGANVAMCDGSSLTLGAGADASVVAALLTRSGHEIIDAHDWR